MEERIRWLDTAKGVGILLVILGHAVTTAIRENSEAAMLLYHFIYFFHMPFLLYLSGYSFRLSIRRYETVKTLAFIKKRGRVLLLPYVAYSLVIYLFFCICSIAGPVGRILREAGYGRISFWQWFGDLLLGNNFYSIHLWYIYALFFMSLMSWFLYKKFHNTGVLLFMGVGLLVITQLINLEFLGAFCKLMFYYIWFALGTVWDVHKISRRRAVLLCIPSALYFVFRFIYLDQTADFSMRWELSVLNIILKAGFVIAAVKISFWLHGRLEKIFHWLGTRSFGLYLFHQPFFGSCLGTFLYAYAALPIIPVVLLSVTLSILCPVILMKVISSLPTHMAWERLQGFWLSGRAGGNKYAD